MVDKFIRSLLFALLCICTFSLAYMVSNDFQDSQIMQQFSQKGETQFSIPDLIDTEADYQKLLQIMEGVSKNADAPFVLRSLYSGDKSDGKGKVDLSQHLKKLDLFRTDLTDKKTETFNAHGIKTIITKQPFGVLSFEQFTNADFFIVGSHQSAALDELITAVNDQFGLNSSQSDWQYKGVGQGGHVAISQNPLESNNYELTGAIVMSLIFFVIFLFIWLMQNNRKITIHRLNGQSVYRIANEIFLKPFLLVLFSSSLLASIAIVRGLSQHYWINLLYLCLVVFTLTYFAVWLVTQMSAVNQINSKPALKYSYASVFLIKIAIFLISLSMISNVTVLLNQSLALSGNQSLKNYAALYPVYNGYGLNPSGPQYLEIFNAAEDLGAWHSKANSVSSLTNLSTTEIDGNYLEKYPLLLENGQKLVIDSASSDGIVLVSSKWESKMLDIKKAVSDVAQFKGQKINYISIKDDQKVIIPGESNYWANTDVCLVYTKSNATSRFTSTLFGNPYGLLIPIKHDLASTYQELLPTLKATHSVSNFSSLISMDQVPTADILSKIGSPAYIFGQIFMFSLFLCMILLSTLFYFRAYQRQIAIKRLQGLSLLKSYDLLYGSVALQYIAGMVSVSTQEGNGGVLFETLFFILLIEILVISLMVRRTNKTAILEILKGDN